MLLWIAALLPFSFHRSQGCLLLSRQYAPVCITATPQHVFQFFTWITAATIAALSVGLSFLCVQEM